MCDFDNSNFTLLVSCMTYNQSQFIGDTLSGFVIQRTCFPFVCLVMDDASTDGEQIVLREFLDKECDMGAASFNDTLEAEIIQVPHKTNPNCTFVVYFLKENLYGNPLKKQLIDIWREKCKYEAFCEGDDYWTDPLKLQKQVSFLESNQDYSICFHSVRVLNSETGLLEDDIITRDIPGSSSIDELGKGNYIHTPSVVIRSNEEANRQKSMLVGVPVGDYPTWVIYSQFGKIYKFSECMGVYRNGVGIWSRLNTIDRRLHWLVMLSKLSCILTDNKTKQIIDVEIKKSRETILTDYCQIENSKDFILGNKILLPLRYLKNYLQRLERFIIRK